MTKTPSQQRFLLLSLLGIGILILGMKSLTSSSPSLLPPTPFPTTAETPSPAASVSSTLITCLPNEELQTIVGSMYVLHREEYLPELNQVECSYQSAAQVRGATPSIEYTAQRTTSDEKWQETSQYITAKPSYRRIEENQNILADLNPGAEVNQATFYGKNEQLYVELSYTPVKEAPGDILAKGVKLTELVLQKTPR